MKTSLDVGILLVPVICIVACSILGECRYKAVDVTLDEFDLCTISLYDLLYDGFFDVLNSTMPRLVYAGHGYLGMKDCVPLVAHQ